MRYQSRFPIENRWLSQHPALRLWFRLSQLLDNRGQGTLEYALIGLVLLTVFVALKLLQHRLGEGLFVLHALRSASHALGPNSAGVVGDVFLY